jgi:hypothetical protein
MLELLLIGFLTLFFIRAAAAENESGLIWGALTAGVCYAVCIHLPGLPFVRVLIAGAAMFALWIGVHLVMDRPA